MAKATAKSLEERVRILEDKEAIFRTKCRYLTGCDTYNPDMVMSTFAKESSADLGPFGMCETRKGVEYFFVKHIPPRLPFMLHRITNIEVDVLNEKTAKLKCYFDVPCTDANKQAVWITGIYNDDFIKEDGEWKMKKMACTFIYHAAYNKSWAEDRFFFKGQGPVLR